MSVWHAKNKGNLTPSPLVVLLSLPITHAFHCLPSKRNCYLYATILTDFFTLSSFASLYYRVYRFELVGTEWDFQQVLTCNRNEERERENRKEKWPILSVHFTINFDWGNLGQYEWKDKIFGFFELLFHQNQTFFLLDVILSFCCLYHTVPPLKLFVPPSFSNYKTKFFKAEPKKSYQQTIRTDGDQTSLFTLLDHTLPSVLLSSNSLR